MYYFAHFLIILPIVSAVERTLPLPTSIADSVLHGQQAESQPAGTSPRPAAAE
jgi:ubiquinol-cytochrome c reductase cytochrome b subunit